MTPKVPKRVARPLPRNDAVDKAGKPVDFATVFPTGRSIDNDCSQRLAMALTRELTIAIPGIVYRSNLVVTGDRGAGVTTVVDDMCRGLIPGADLSGPEVLRVELGGNMTVNTTFRAILDAENGRLGVPSAERASSASMQELLRVALRDKQIRYVLFEYGELAVTMSEARGEAFMTTLNTLLAQANCCAIIQATRNTKRAYAKGETAERRFRQIDMGDFESQAEVDRYYRNWDDWFGALPDKGLPFGGAAADKAVVARVWAETNRSLSDVTDALKRAVVIATLHQEPLGDAAMRDALC